MARLNVLEYAADFIRGWPHGEAVEMNYPSVSASESLGNGDVVAVVNGKVQKATGAAGEVLGMVARGKSDTFAGGGTGTNNLYQQAVPNIVLLSNFVVRTYNVDDANVPAAGGKVYVDAAGKLTSVPGTSEVFGTCLEGAESVKDADGNSHTAIVVLVK